MCGRCRWPLKVLWLRVRNPMARCTVCDVAKRRHCEMHCACCPHVLATQLSQRTDFCTNPVKEAVVKEGLRCPLFTGWLYLLSGWGPCVLKREMICFNSGLMKLLHGHLLIFKPEFSTFFLCVWERDFWVFVPYTWECLNTLFNVYTCGIFCFRLLGLEK